MTVPRSSKDILPDHIGFIIDGNRRWASRKNFATFIGHKKGTERVEEIIKYAQDLGIKIITIYAFSTENFKRSKKEVSYLMWLIEDFIINKITDIHKRGIKVRISGDFKRLPRSLQKVLEKAIRMTENNKNMIVNVAINYGGRDELVRTFRKLVAARIKPEEINEELISKNLDTAGLPDPDLIIRTSGEYRLSNFLPWQGVYSELYFSKVNWPDFDKNQLDIAIKEFQKRQRRLGK